MKTIADDNDDDFDDEYINSLIQTQSTDFYQIIRRSDNNFVVVDIKTNNDDLSAYVDLLRYYGLVDEDNQLKAFIKILVLQHSTIKVDVIFYGILKGMLWVDTLIEPSDTIEVFGSIDETHLSILIEDQYEIKDKFFLSTNFLIVEPSYMISPTTITASYPCYRRPMLLANFAGRDLDVSLPMVRGSILHSMFEIIAETHEKFSDIELENKIKELVKDEMDSLYYLGANQEELIKDLVMMICPIQNFIQKYFNNNEDLTLFNHDKNTQVKILKVIDIESTITSNTMGLKGKLDLIIFCEYIKMNEIKRAIIPFELKTGDKEAQSHIGQTLIYSLLLMQKYNQIENINGLLYYLKHNKLMTVKFKIQEILNLIHRRNRYVKYLKNLYQAEGNGIVLPPMISNYGECNKCIVSPICSAINHTIENKSSCVQNGCDNNIRKRKTMASVIADIEDMPTISKEFKVYHEIKEMLDDKIKDYINKWMNLIQIEEKFEKSKMHIAGTLYDNQFQGIILENLAEFKEFMHQNNNDPPTQILKQNPKIQSFLLIFSKTFEDKEYALRFSEKYKLSDFVYLDQSTLECHIKGHIQQKKLKKYKENGKKYYTISITIKCSYQDIHININKLNVLDNSEYQTIWFMEKYEKNFYPLMRGNVIDLALNEQSQRLTDLIIKLYKPEYNALTDDDKEILHKLCKDTEFNEDQYHALERSLTAKDYHLILGMPGTGKTFVIIGLIMGLLHKQMKILISCYTHIAIDNILKRLIDQYPETKDKIIRIASNKYQVDEHLRDYIYDKKKMNSIDDIHELISKKQIFAVTCLSTVHPILSKISFDVCIMDEASQVLEPISLGPLFLAKKFILIGDYFQLQPLVKSYEAIKKGMGISLFEKLSKGQPSALTSLKYQYRMNEEIMTLSNILIYEKRLKVPNESVGKSKLKLANMEPIMHSKWLKDVLHEERRMIFLNLDNLSSMKVENKAEIEKNFLSEHSEESFDIALSFLNSNSNTTHSNNSFFSDKDVNKNMNNPNKPKNKIDLKLVIIITNKILECGIIPDALGVITLLNSEKRYLNSRLENTKVGVYTVDKSQGIDKDCIIINMGINKGGSDQLLENWRRINVAFTRAKKKLIIVGSINRLNQIYSMQQFMNLIVANRWVYDIEDQMIAQIEENLVNKPTTQSFCTL